MLKLGRSLGWENAAVQAFKVMAGEAPVILP